MTEFTELIERLESRLAEPLPGHPGQAYMAPRPRKGWTPGHLPEDSRRGAGLLLVYPLDGRPGVLLTVRDGALPQHAGQISLPGGALEPGESDAQAALREAAEEVGLAPDGVSVLGELTPLHIPASGFNLHPVVARAERRPSFTPQAGEVARILEVGVHTLADPRTLVVERHTLAGNEYQVPFFDLAGDKVWGATAMILAEFLTVLGTPPDPWAERDAD